MHSKLYFTHDQFIFFFATLFLFDSFFWYVASQHVHEKKDERACIIFSILTTCTGIIDLLPIVLYRYNGWFLMGCFTGGLFISLPAGISKRNIRSGYWKPLNEGYAKHHDYPELLIISIAMLISVTKMGHNFFVGVSGIFWMIASAIAFQRCFDPVTASLVARLPKIRKKVLWATRILIIIALLTKLLYMI